jgi:GT2 family glycosyltransferase
MYEMFRMLEVVDDADRVDQVELVSAADLVSASLAAADPRIRVLDNPTNLGFGGSYKRGASVATATYVMMLPGDDGFPGQSIAEILAMLAKQT